MESLSKELQEQNLSIRDITNAVRMGNGYARQLSAKGMQIYEDFEDIERKAKALNIVRAAVGIGNLTMGALNNALPGIRLLSTGYSNAAQQ